MSRRREGVASVVGTLFFILVFMIAMGAQAYASGLQAQSSAASQEAVQVSAMRARELLVFGLTGSALTATDAGPASVGINHVVLRFPNGTVYSLAAVGALGTGASLSVQSLVPPGICLPGTATCLSKYTQIVAGNPLESALGLVTSLGNTFWYEYQPPSGPSSSGLVTVRTTADKTTTGTNNYASTTLVAALAPNTNYVFYALTAISPTTGVEKYNFEVHPLPAGASLVIACTPLSYPIGGGANMPTNCVSATGTPIATRDNLGFGVTPPAFETPGLFGTVTVGANGGTLEIDFACTSNCGGVTIKAGSLLVVQTVS